MLFISDGFNSSGMSNTPLPEINLCFPSSFQLPVSALSSWTRCWFPALFSAESRARELTAFLANRPGSQHPNQLNSELGRVVWEGRRAKGNFFSWEYLCWLAAFPCWCYYFQHGREPDEYRPEAIMVGPNCRVYITLDNADREGI